MKLYYFKIPEKRVLEFIKLCESIDVSVLISWSIEGDMFGGDNIAGYIRVHKSTVPEQMQMDKLNEKFGNFLKAI